MIYDVIIIGAGASGLFAGIHLDKKLNKLILEKMPKIGTKLLLSGGERSNVSNMNIELEDSYFSQNKKFLRSIFSKYNQWDFMNFCAENGLNLVEEDRGRLILESGKSKEILELFLLKIKENNCEIKLNSEVKKIKIPHPNPLLIKEREQDQNCILSGKNNLYEIFLEDGNKYLTKNLIVSTGGKSFYQFGTTGDGYNFAKEFGLNVINTLPGLCGITTKKDLSELSGISVNTNIELYDKVIKKVIYSEKGPLLFTHFGLSGPIIFNCSVFIGEYMGIMNDVNDINYFIGNNLSIQLEFELDNLPKKIINFFCISEENKKVILAIHSLRSLKEAKVTTGGVDLDELDNNMQSKKHQGLFFIGEVLDVTGKTGGYNLQWCWSSAYVACNYLNK